MVAATATGAAEEFEFEESLDSEPDDVYVALGDHPMCSSGDKFDE